MLIRDADGALADSVVYDVFSRSYPAGTVSLGANLDHAGILSGLGRALGKTPAGHMYLVCIDPR